MMSTQPAPAAHAPVAEAVEGGVATSAQKSTALPLGDNITSLRIFQYITKKEKRKRKNDMIKPISTNCIFLDKI